MFSLLLFTFLSLSHAENSCLDLFSKVQENAPILSNPSTFEFEVRRYSDKEIARILEFRNYLFRRNGLLAPYLFSMELPTWWAREQRRLNRSFEKPFRLLVQLENLSESLAHKIARFHENRTLVLGVFDRQIPAHSIHANTTLLSFPEREAFHDIEEDFILQAYTSFTEKGLEAFRMYYGIEFRMEGDRFILDLSSRPLVIDEIAANLGQTTDRTRRELDQSIHAFREQLLKQGDTQLSDLLKMIDQLRARSSFGRDWPLWEE